jgi:UDP-N-acetylglucosamine 1-carboxyvinyltransferase
LREFGVVVSERRNGLVLAWPDPRPARIEFAYPSMTGTSIAIAAAACVDGTSEIVNPTSEPSVADQIMCGRELGADIAVADGVVHVTGGPLSHVEAMVSPDRVLAATYLSAALLAGGTVTVRGNAPLRIPQFTRFLSRLGVEHHDAGDAISVVAPPPPDALPACDLVAGSEPKFSSDWAPFATLVLATRTSGRSRVQDDVFPDRFQFVDTLRPWGLDNVEVLRTARRADVTVHGTGSRRLSGGSVPTLPDIRGGAAIVLSAVLSDTGIDVGDTFQVDRGYTDLARDLRELGMTAAATSGVHA